LHFYLKLKILVNTSPHFSKTRFAPTPSGFLHLGNVLSFVITATLARNTGAKILLRIDDLDQARVNRHFIQDIFDTLNFLEIPWDEGPRDIVEFESAYSQLCRIDLYQKALQQLAVEGKVFACSCSRKQLLSAGPCSCLAQKIPLNSDNISWRLITDMNRALTVKNINSEISRVELPVEMLYFIIKKKDGFPAYQLTSLIDDLFYDIDMVIRGNDLWPSTIAQHELAFALGKTSFNEIAFHHHTLLMGPDDNKLSKSAGVTSVKHLRENGKKPAEIFSFIARLLNRKENVADWQQLGLLLHH